MIRTKHNNNLWVGIDPGSSSGGAALIGDDYNPKCTTMRFKDITEKELFGWFKSIAQYETCSVIIEKVHSFPGQGVSSTFKFGENYGMLKGFLMALDIPFKQVSPQRWQAYFGMKRSKDEPQPAWKRRLRQRAQELYPSIKITAETADAVLIAEYCKHNY